MASVRSVYPLVAIGGADTVAALRGEEALERGRARSRRFHLAYAALLGLLVPGLYLVLVPVVGEATGELVTALLGVLGALAFVVVLSLLMPFVLSGLCAAIARPLTSLAPFAGSIATRAMADAPARIGVSASALVAFPASPRASSGCTA